MKRKIGFWEAFSIGVGGMVGGGIFAVLGLTIDLAKGAAPIAFIIAGIIALITSYSYVKLSLSYPSEGGSIEYIVQAFGNNLFSAVINNFLLMSYVIMLSLYAYAFGSYASALFLGKDVVWFHKVFASGVIVLFVFINLMGAFLTGKAEDIMVLIKVLILIIFVGFGIFSADFHRLSPEFWESSTKIITGGLIIFLAYEGFELIANTAKDIENPQKTLPKAFYSAVIFVILLYVSIAVVTVGNVSFEEAKKAQDYVLAIAVEPFFGKIGFMIISVAALLSTASAINATLYGGGRVGYLVAKLGELPSEFGKKVKEGYEGMLILGLFAIIFTTTFDLKNISVAGSLGFLVIFGLVNLANFKLRHKTKANSFISLLGFLFCLLASAILIGYNLKHSPSSLMSSLMLIVVVVLFSVIYNKYGTKMKSVLDEDLRKGS